MLLSRMLARQSSLVQAQSWPGSDSADVTLFGSIANYKEFLADGMMSESELSGPCLDMYQRRFRFNQRKRNAAYKFVSAFQSA